MRVDLLMLVWSSTLWMSFAAVQAEDAELRDSTGTTLRLLAPGRFEMGSRDVGPGFSKDHSDFNSAEDDRPVHPVVLTVPFYLAATEVTVGQFRRFVTETGYVTSAEKNGQGIVGWDPTPPNNNPRFVATFRQKPEFTWKSPGFEQTDAHPVVGVSCEDAKAYCAWLSRKENATYRLPTEAEWEYAARAGTETWFSFGDAYRGVIQRFANVGNVELEKAFPDRVRRQWLVDVERDPPDRHVFTAPVASYEASPWKLHDLHGNVWEWCEDRYLDTYYGNFGRAGYQQVRKRAIDPRNDEKWNDSGDWRVIRGGSWFTAPIQCRSSHRSYFDASDAACHLGFRVVREASATARNEARARFERSEKARAAIEAAVGPYRENRDGRLTIRLRRDKIAPGLVERLTELDEPIDLFVDGQSQLTGDDVAALTVAPQLRGLLLSNVGAKIADGDLAPVAKHPDLEMLQVNETLSLTDGVFAHLTGLKRLEFLSLQGTGITDAGLERLPALPRLKTLHLMTTRSTGAVLAKLEGAPLESASFADFRDEHAPLWRRFPRMRDLRLSGSPITGATIEEIGRMAQLTSLDLDRCARLTDADFAPLARCLLLQRLNVDKTAAGDAAAAAISGLNSLGDLRLGGPALTDAGARTLCAAVSLRSLSIQSDATSLTDEGLRDIWRLRNLQSLEIAAPGVTGSGLSALHELPDLKTLSLQSRGLTDAGLSAAAKCESLEQLTVGWWQVGGPSGVGDVGLAALGKARGLKRLELFRKNTGVSDEAIATIRTERPGLQLNVR